MFACMKCSWFSWFPQIREHFMHTNSPPCWQFYTTFRVTKIGVIPLKMVRFSIQNHRWKALEVSNPKICKVYMHVNCLWPKFAKFSCCKHFMLYSNFSHFSFQYICLPQHGKPVLQLNGLWTPQPHALLFWRLVTKIWRKATISCSPLMTALQLNPLSMPLYHGMLLNKSHFLCKARLPVAWIFGEA